MHVRCQSDPAPDSAEFYNHVHCEHGGLTLNMTSRRKISAEVGSEFWSFLTDFDQSVGGVVIADALSPVAPTVNQCGTMCCLRV